MILIDTRDPPQLSVIDIGRTRVRIYPPFRSGPANWLSTPPVRAFEIPYLPGKKPTHLVDDGSTLISMAAVPGLNVPGLQDTAVQLQMSPNWEKGRCPIIFPMDSLRVDFPPQTAGMIEVVDPMALCNRLMGHVRSFSRQWWITRSSDALHGWRRNEFVIDEFGIPQGSPYAHVQGHSPGGFELPVSRQIWEDAVLASEAGEEPPVVDQLMMDAEYFRATTDYRRMVLDAAAACEITKDDAFEQLRLRNNVTAYKRGKVQRTYDLPRNLDPDLLAIAGKSLKTVLPEIFLAVENLWDARGNVAHGESAYYRSNGGKVTLDATNSVVLLAAIRTCVRWLKAL